jgi:hypothetical protein
MLIGDIIRFIIALIFVFFIVIEVLEKIGLYLNDISKIYNPKMLITLFLVISYTYSFIIKIVYLNNNAETYFNPDMTQYLDTYYISVLNKRCYYIESLILGCVLIKIITFFNLSRKMKLFYNSVENGFERYSKYSLFVLVILLFFASIAHILWGPYIKEFSIFGLAFLQTFLFTLGNCYLIFRILGFEFIATIQSCLDSDFYDNFLCFCSFLYVFDFYCSLC